MDGGVEVYWARDVGEAHLVAGMLEAEGIAAEVTNEMLQASVGELPLGGSSAPRVCVAGVDAERARAIVAEWDRRRAVEPSETWLCAECGEQVDAGLTTCDFCYTPRGTPKPEPEPEIRAAHAIAIFVVWIVAAVGAGFVLMMLDMPFWAAALLVDLVAAVVLVKLTQSVLGGSYGERGRAMVGLVPAPTWTLVLGAVAGFGVAAAYFIAALTILPPDDAPIDLLTELGSSSPFGFGVWMVLAVGIAPFFEEYLFRGVMLYGFRQRWGWTVSTILVTALFVSVHISSDTYWPGLPFIAIGAVVGAWLRIRTGSIYPAVVEHLCHNLFMGIWIYLDESPSW
ncbi:MAG: CPBP family glutamic-type intramembrane protease [Planctomycetota bacterium]|jgi:membrane protease YdiL (CAAX protease family)